MRSRRRSRSNVTGSTNCPGLRTSKPVVKHPDFDAQSLIAIVAVGDGVDDGFLPGERGVLQLLLEEEVKKPVAFPDVGPHGLVGHFDESYQRGLQPDPLDDVQLCSVAAFRALVLDKVDPTAGMPAARILAKEQQCRQGRDQPAIAWLTQAVVQQHLLVRQPQPRAFSERCEQSLVQVGRRSLRHEARFGHAASLAGLDGLDLVGGKGNIAVADAQQVASIAQLVNFRAPVGLKEQDRLPLELCCLGTDLEGWTDVRLSNAVQDLQAVVRVVHAGHVAVVLLPQDQDSAVGVGHRGHGFGDVAGEFAHFAPVGPAGLALVTTLAVEEWAFFSAEDPVHVLCGRFLHHWPPRAAATIFFTSVHVNTNAAPARCKVFSFTRSVLVCAARLLCSKGARV